MQRNRIDSCFVGLMLSQPWKLCAPNQESPVVHVIILEVHLSKSERHCQDQP